MQQNKTFNFCIIIVTLIIICVAIWGCLIKINYKLAQQYAEQAQLKKAYSNISVVHFLFPQYKDTTFLYNKYKFAYYYTKFIECSNQEEYDNAIIELNNGKGTDKKINAIIDSAIEFSEAQKLLKEAAKEEKNFHYDKAIKLCQKALSKKFDLYLNFQHHLKYNKSVIITPKLYRENLNKNIIQLNLAQNKLLKQFNQLKTQMEIEKDVITNFYLIKDKHMMWAHYFNNIALCINKTDNKYKLAFFINHMDKQWINLETVYFNIDGYKETIPIHTSQPVRNIVSILGMPVHRESLVLDESYLQKTIFDLIDKIPKSQHAYIRLEGKNGKHDWEITKEEKESISRVYEYYYYLNILKLK